MSNTLEVRFEKCECREDGKFIHGYFYKGEGRDGQLPIPIFSLAAGRRAMERLAEHFGEKKAELEKAMQAAGLPEEITLPDNPLATGTALVNEEIDKMNAEFAIIETLVASMRPPLTRSR